MNSCSDDSQQGRDSALPQFENSDENLIFTLELSTLEVIFLSDNIKNRYVDEGDPDRVGIDEPIARGLLVKIGSLYLQLVPLDGNLTDKVKKSSAPIRVTLKEAWLIRDLTRFGDLGADNATCVGFSILRKVYQILTDNSIDVGLEVIETSGDRNILNSEKEQLRAKYGRPDA